MRAGTAISVACVLLVAGTAQAQYGYGSPYTNPYGYGFHDSFANPYMTGMPTFEQLMQLSQAQMEAINQRMAVLQQQIDARMAEINRTFADYYRQQTGDYQTPDAQAGQLGMNLWCTNNPVECQEARAASQASSALADQSWAAHQQRMAQNQASFDAYQQGVAAVSAAQDASFDSWMTGQDASYQAHQDYIQGAIYGEDDYVNPATGQGYSLPFAPDQNWTYYSPVGNPLWFDPSTNIWYEIGPAGSYTPYYQGQ